jgi:3-methyl-2-oxobutanoate hydroxymethyltransferase
VHPGIEHFRTAKGSGGKLAILTAYDYPLGRLLDEGDVDAILVGDSLGMVVLGHPDTTSVTMEDMLHHTRAVARAVRRAPVIADLPIHSYETPEAALENARALIAAGAHAVKLEGGLARRAEIGAITQAGIPLMGHIGMLPQSVVEEGGYRIKGRTPQEAGALLADAAAVQEAGAFAVVLELVKGEAARRITETIRIPTIGIGSGSGCDGQVLVTHDLIGLFPWFTPKFVSPRAQVAEEIRRAVSEYVSATRAPEAE